MNGNIIQQKKEERENLQKKLEILQNNSNKTSEELKEMENTLKKIQVQLKENEQKKKPKNINEKIENMKQKTKKGEQENTENTVNPIILTQKEENDVIDKIINNEEKPIEITAEERLQTEKNALEDEKTINDEEWEDFIKNGKVSEKILEDITEKYKNGILLNNRENSIFIDKTPEIEERLKKIKSEETIENEEQIKENNEVKEEEIKTKEKEEPKSEEENEPKTKIEFDTQKVIEEINKKISEKEEDNGASLSKEQKEELAKEMFLKAKEDFNQKVTESPSKIKNALKKTSEWLKGIDKKAAGKAAGKALLLSGVTIGIGTILGINTSNLTVTALKMGGRGLTAAGLNIAVTSNLFHKFLSKKEKSSTENKNWLKRNFGWGDAASALGIGLSAILSGGLLAIPAIAIGGYTFRKILNGGFDNKIKKLENENTEESKAKANKLKFWKSVFGGAGIIAAGLGTMAVYQNTYHDAEVEKIKHDIETKQVEDLRTKIDIALKNKYSTEGHTSQIEEQTTLSDAIIHKGEGIEHAFIRQIEHNQELAKELGYKGNINDVEALHEFAGKQAHLLAIKEGYVNNSGNEVRVMEADKIAYEIKIQNGHLIVEEKNLNGEVLETHHEGDKFEETADKYEKTHSNIQEQHKISPESILLEDKSGNGSEHIISEYEDTSEGEVINEYDDTSVKTTHPAEEKYDQQEEIKNEQINIDKEQKIIEYEDNPYNFSDKILEKINENYKNNIEIISPENKDIFKHMQLNAEETIKQDLNATNETYKPSISYIQELEKVTGIHPRGTTVFQSPETNTEYITRVSQIEAQKGILLKAVVDTNKVTHIEEIKL